MSTGGGGYAITNVVPRAWTHLLAIVGGEPMPPGTATPLAWRTSWARMPRESMTDGGHVEFTDFESGYSPSSRLDQAIIATRKAVFPGARARPGSALTGRRERSRRSATA